MHFFRDEGCSKDHTRSVVAVDAGASVDRLGEASLISQCNCIFEYVVGNMQDCCGAIPLAEEKCGLPLCCLLPSTYLGKLNVKMGKVGRFLP